MAASKSTSHNKRNRGRDRRKDDIRSKHSRTIIRQGAQAKAKPLLIMPGKKKLVVGNMVQTAPIIMAPLQQVPKAPQTSSMAPTPIPAATPISNPSANPSPNNVTQNQQPSVSDLPQALGLDKINKAKAKHECKIKGRRRTSNSTENNTPSVEKPSSVEKPPPTIRGTVRRKKHNSSSSTENKTSSENEKRGKNSRNSTSEGSGEANEKKSEGSKEPSENEKAEMAQMAKKESAERHEQEAAKARMRAEDSRMERMPSSYHLNASARALRRKGPPKVPLSTDFYKPNGDPFWVQENMPDDGKCPRGDNVNPEVAQAIADDNVFPDEFEWAPLAIKQREQTLTEGEEKFLENHFTPDPYGPSESLEKLEFMNLDALKYNTAKFMADYSIRRVPNSGLEDIEEHRRRPPAQAPELTPEDTEIADTQSFEEAKAQTSFDVTQNFRILYDRHHPIASIRKFRKKYGLSVENTQTPSKETS